MESDQVSKRTWVIVAAMACVPGLGFAQSNGSQSQNPSPPPPMQKGNASMPDAQRKTAVAIGASAGFGISYLPLVQSKDA